MEVMMNLKSKFKRLLSAILSFAVIGTALPSTLAVAEEVEKYPYSVFGRNGITVSASSNLCINGNIHTNKEADISYSNGNINGKITTGNDIEKRVKHVYSDQKIMETYFTENCDIHEEEYVYSDMNIHINNPLFCYNNITLNGNVSLNSNLGTYMNLNITGEVKNANTSVVYSKYGDITIENDSTANINGLIYAPLGTLTINSPNINLNGVIIADKIVINGSSVNINYKDDIAQFIGSTSEVYDFSGLEYLPEDWPGDTDEDGLFDIYEKVIDTDPLNPDTDGDGLPDGYEVITLNTDPLEIDTDGNGISDADEDFDNDNLNNLGEYQNLTEPFNPDTDDDGFLDGDEVYTYNTDPLNPDTDNDGLLDGEESYDGSMYTKYGVYFDPLNPDTNGNGILDGDEVFGQSKQQSVETYDETITDVKVDMDTNGNIERNLSIESMYNIDAMSTNVYAMIGEPFNFTSSTNFKSATITFKIDQSKLGDTLFDNLIILWYNEEDQVFEEMPTTRDAVNSTVSTTTTHFSQYMVVDSQKWYANWNNSLSELRKMWTAGTSYQRNLHTILMMDCSSSAYSSDPYSPSLKVGYNGVTSENIEDIRNSINSQWDAEYYCVKSCDRFDICDGIINNKGSNDAVALITFAGGVVSNSGWIYSKGTLRNVLAQNIGNYGGIGSWRSAISTALSMVKQDTSDIYRIVIISDTNANSGVISSNEFASNVILNVVNVGTGSFGNNIEEVAQATGGDVYNAISASDLTYQTGGIITSPEQFIGTDSDGDGIPDIVELYGLKPNGEPINTDPNKKDTDGDGIDDNVELGYIPGVLTSSATIADYVRALKPHSDPAKADTDGDRLNDKEDKAPLTTANSKKIDDADKDELRERLISQRDEDIDLFFTDLKNLYSANKCVDIIFENDQIITDVANKYNMPKAYIQSVIFRELYCYGADDPLADVAFKNYYLYNEQVEWYLAQSPLYQALVDFPTPLIPYRENTSTGLGQIQLTTAITANNWGYGKAYKTIYLEDTWQTRRDIYLELQDENFNIDMVALVLMWGLTTGDECAISNPGEKYWLFSEEAIKAMFTRYNSNGGVINEYGKATYNLYLIFEEYQ